MPEIAEIWKEALPKVKQGVTGVGVWTALNTSVAIALEDGVFVLGLPYESSNLAGHLKVPQTSRLIEATVGKIAGSPVKVRVIQGTVAEEWERVKRRDQESERLQQQATQKDQKKLQARSSWDGVYEQLGRTYASLVSKSLPQNQARFLADAVKLLAEARQANSVRDELNERNFARCIERVAQFCELPGSLVAMQVLEAAGEI